MFRSVRCLRAKEVSLVQVKSLVLAKLGRSAGKATSSSPTDKILLVDVRTEEEVARGVIPCSLHMPLPQLQDILLQRSPIDKYGTTFDDASTLQLDAASHQLVFYCAAGVRSLTAISIAEGCGYRAASHYRGGWNEYEKQPLTKRDIDEFLRTQS